MGGSGGQPRSVAHAPQRMHGRQLAPKTKGEHDYAARGRAYASVRPTVGSRARTRSDDLRCRPRLERLAGRRRRRRGLHLGDHAHDQASGFYGRGRRARRVGERAAVEQPLDFGAGRVEPDPAGQQLARVPLADAGSLLQGRGSIRAGGLRLVAVLVVLGDRGCPRLQERRPDDSDRRAQRRIHTQHKVRDCPIDHDDRARRRRRRLFRHEREQANQAAERDDRGLPDDLGKPGLGAQRRGLSRRAICRRAVRD
jgi:hypothetical protein